VGNLFWTLLSAFTLVVTTSLAAIVMHGRRQVRNLGDSLPELPKRADGAARSWPSVTIIVPARNEETHVATAVKSLLAQNYDDYEVLVVNDRSTDQTGLILHSLAADEPRLTVVDVKSLPQGWLGKNHALHFGAEKARGDILLFADADVSMAPSVLKRSVAFLIREELDHLPIAPDVVMPNWFLDSFVLTFFMCFNSYFLPWKAKDRTSEAYVGVGAFNMIRAGVFRGLGGLSRIKMRPDDDVMLGRLVKHNGFRQEVLYSGDLISVPWYGSIREVIHGLMKNAFAGLNYRAWITVGSSILATTCLVIPFIAVWFVSGSARWFYLASIVAIMTMMVDVAIAARKRPWVVVAFPVTILLLAYIQWRAMILTYWQNGIVWRGTHYSLAELRANSIDVG
jgi:glycosyltransferase involved in cell wall biosynthesis